MYSPGPETKLGIPTLSMTLGIYKVVSNELLLLRRLQLYSSLLVIVFFISTRVAVEVVFARHHIMPEVLNTFVER